MNISTLHDDEEEDRDEEAMRRGGGNDGPIDVEKIKPNVQENKGEIRSAKSIEPRSCAIEQTCTIDYSIRK